MRSEALAQRSAHIGIMRAIFAHGSEYRRCGSAALGLALVADGRLDAFTEIHLNACDVAAGIVLVNEAGGWTLSGPATQHTKFWVVTPSLVSYHCRNTLQRCRRTAVRA